MSRLQDWCDFLVLENIIISYSFLFVNINWVWQLNPVMFLKDYLYIIALLVYSNDEQKMRCK